MPRPARLVKMEQLVGCNLDECEPEMRGGCTEELCEEYKRQSLYAAASLYKDMVLLKGNETRRRRTTLGIPCNAFTCREEVRHWGCTEDLCVGVNISTAANLSTTDVITSLFDHGNGTDDKPDEFGSKVIDIAWDEKKWEWIPGRDISSPLMPKECVRPCEDPKTPWDMETPQCRPYVQVCREVYQQAVSCRQSTATFSLSFLLFSHRGKVTRKFSTVPSAQG
jgi:hypothetical protein